MSTKKDKFSSKDRLYMDIALKLARSQYGHTGSNPSVGKRQTSRVRLSDFADHADISPASTVRYESAVHEMAFANEHSI